MITTVEAWPQEQGASQTAALFADAFGYEPTGVWQAPGRVNLIGEHTDYNGGLCLPIALPHRTYAAMSLRDDDKRLVRLVSAQADGITEIRLDDVGRHDSDQRVDSWAAYPLGVLWAMEQRGYGPIPSMDIAIDSCVPFGAGLSSSAALECAVAVGADELMGWQLGGSADAPNDEGRVVLTQACISAENDIAGANTGGLDQTASLRCLKGQAILLDCRDNSCIPVNFDLERARCVLLVIDTKAPHSLNDGQYASRRAACENAARQLGVNLLADIDPSGLDDALSRLDDPVEVKRVRHVVTEIARTAQAEKLLNGQGISVDSLKALGELFYQSHYSLRDDYEVTCPQLDVAVDVAKECGAYGARMTGGGFGGSAIAIVPMDAWEQTASAIAHAYDDHGFDAPEFLVVRPDEPAGRARQGR